MNIGETTQALALAQAFDNRTVGEMNIRAWHAVIGDCDYRDVVQAIQEHYGSTTDWVMPAHILGRVAVMKQKRAAAERDTGWAPGQAGIPRAEALPEIAGPIVTAEGLSPQVRALLDSVRAMLPEGSREHLMPRTVAWEREQKAFLRTRDGEPNPLYKPTADDVAAIGKLGSDDHNPFRPACEYHTDGGYGFKWDCGACRKVADAGPIPQFDA